MSQTIIKHIPNGFEHWAIQRSSAITLFVSLMSIFIFSTNGFLIGFLTLFIVLIHFESGVETIINDYTHNPASIEMSFLLLDLLIIYVSKSIFLVALF
uniref:Succinate:cytochrome c oxidoreductase subunit 4 n=1 Tax=Proteomonas sulcata TaxID=77928 RepID=A0A2P1G8D8_9CRYP|nr:succinate:cytochrome c oxidoreductase subunit 4 [Proteomonas sulcata]AVM81203.1 succinate:cytochrome c oxidoreductase subunit 4 [Proteomonas sulcata]